MCSRAARSAPAGKDEAAQRRQRLVERIDPLLEPFDLRRHDPQDHCRRRKVVPRRGEIGAEVEQVVLDAPAVADEFAAAIHRQHRPAEHRVRLVDRADRLEPRRVLGQPRARRPARSCRRRRCGCRSG
jgi:chromatin segregation and condensation protein Rec8/ScpA/Scc1 (kleisin family)